MEAMNRNCDTVAGMIRNAQTIAVCSHVNPDGDTLGCATAMQIALTRLGKDVSLFCDGKVPDQLSFLPGIHERGLVKKFTRLNSFWGRYEFTDEIPGDPRLLCG